MEMAQLEKKSDAISQEETQLEVENANEQPILDNLEETEPSEEGKVESDAFDITKKFKHNQVPCFIEET